MYSCLLLLRKFLTLGCCANQAITRCLQVGKRYSCTIIVDSEIYLGRGIHEYLVSERGFRIRSGLIPLPVSLYSAHNPLAPPKRGISFLSISSISYHGGSKKRKTKHNLSCLTVLVSFPQHTQLTDGHNTGCLQSASPSLHWVVSLPFLQLS